MPKRAAHQQDSGIGCFSVSLGPVSATSEKGARGKDREMAKGMIGDYNKGKVYHTAERQKDIKLIFREQQVLGLW